jgi:hypothetical protein
MAWGSRSRAFVDFEKPPVIVNRFKMVGGFTKSVPRRGVWHGLVVRRRRGGDAVRRCGGAAAGRRAVRQLPGGGLQDRWWWLGSFGGGSGVGQWGAGVGSWSGSWLFTVVRKPVDRLRCGAWGSAVSEVRDR